LGTAPTPSIHSLPPLERGGVEARIGFAIQDHVAASYLIHLLEEPTLLEVWCETHDDITLIRQGQATQEVEFVQVKSQALDQLWSVAILSRPDRKDGKVQQGSSIYERSLANDRCCEPCRFRLVTCLPSNSNLGVLQLPHDAPDRTAKADALKKLADDLDKRTNNFRSSNGNGAHFWLCRLRWEVRQSGDSLSNDSKMKLSRLLANKGMTLFPDQLDDLYSRILSKARDAATSDWGACPSSKKICKECMTRWLDYYLESRRSQPTTAGTRLKDKLARAGLADGDVAASIVSRQRYLSERFNPQYLKLSDLSHLGDEVSAVLQGLRAKLDSGELADDGIGFHCECLKAIEQLQHRHSDLRPPLSVLQGCMYDIADRCVHRFRKESA
jgi:Cap4 dsDNA endonuclease